MEIVKYWFIQLYENEEEKYPETQNLWEPPIQKMVTLAEDAIKRSQVPWEAYPGSFFRKATDCMTTASNIVDEGGFAVRCIYVNDEEILYYDHEGQALDDEGREIGKRDTFKTTI